jgi:GTP-binding protein YchF
MLRAGIVGLPNVGKSTLFNAVTRTRNAQAANYPFCTIEPNSGIVTVPDDRLAVLSNISKSQKIIPAVFEFVDIAGLVKGASTGEGLGNKFLTHIREVDAIIQVVRCFENDDILHVSGSVDPVRDIEVINTELILADLATVQKREEKNAKAARGGDKVAKAENELIAKLKPHLDTGKTAIMLDVTPDEKALLKNFFLLTGKPTLFACNVAEDELANPDANPHVKAVRNYVQAHLNTEAVVISAQIESDLVDLSADEQKEYLGSLGVKESGVGSLIRAAYHLLGLRTYFTTGEKAPAAAGVIHSDFERGFIAAECTAYEELVKLGSFAKAREAGRLRIEGKEYTVQDGDVLEFRFNV